MHSKNDIPKQAAEALFYIGKHSLKLESGERDFIISPVTQFVIHPEWNSGAESFDSDIAIAILSRLVAFSQFIKPICLWNGSDNYYDIVNKYGIVAGYGKTNARATHSEIPYWTALPVVDEGTCLRSNFQLAKITSRRTFCVGSRDGRGPCQGLLIIDVIVFGFF